MGSENSKSEYEQTSEKKGSARNIRDMQRLYSEDEIQRALASQKRMFEAKQLEMQRSSTIYPNLQTQNINTINSPSTSNAVHYSVTPSAPPENDSPKYNASRQSYQQTNNVLMSRSATPSSAGPSRVTPPSAGPSYVTRPSVEPSHVTPSSAWPSHVTPSSAGPSHVTPSSAGSSYVTPSSAKTSYVTPPSLKLSHVTPSAGPSYVTPSSAGPSHVTPSSAGSSYVTPSSAKTSYVTPPSLKLSHVTPSAGPSYVTPSSAGPSHVTPSSAGPSHAEPASKNNKKRNPAQLTISRSRFLRSPSSGPSHAAPGSAGPSRVEPAFKRNQKRNEAPQTRSRSWCKRELNQIVNCVTCKGQLSLHIYQCTNGHSSCDGCRLKMARCGKCTELITNMRNITLESTLAGVTINAEDRIKCSNATDGCRLHFKRAELQNHLKECPFNIISCPVMELSEDCHWKGTIKQLETHFNEAHPKHCEADVNKEIEIILLKLDYKLMYLVNVAPYKFLVHIHFNTSLNNIYMVTQHLGTSFSAAKWTYEWHVYNKKEPRRKLEYVDVCKSNATPLSEIINNNNCAVISMDYAKTFLDNGKLTFKFYIKKLFHNKNNDHTTSN